MSFKEFATLLKLAYLLVYRVVGSITLLVLHVCSICGDVPLLLLILAVWLFPPFFDRHG